MVPRKILWLSVLLDGDDNYILFSFEVKNNFTLLNNSTHNCSKYSSYHFIRFYI